MLGWDVFIYKREDDSRPGTLLRDVCIAWWTTNPWGLKWIDRLVEEGKAAELDDKSSVICRAFTMPAAVMLSILADGMPENDGPPVFGDDYYLPQGWQGNVQFNRERLADCQNDDEVIVEAWDTS